MHIAFCHHLSLAYYGGGEKWIVSLARELVKRGHDVEIHALPFLLEGKPKVEPGGVLDGIPYREGYRHKVRADVTYVTYNPLSWLSFDTSSPRIAGIHSYVYWVDPHPSYGALPNVANLANRFTSYFELRRFNAIHTVSNAHPVNHPRVYFIPDFVDSEKFRPCKKDAEFSVAFISRMVWQKGVDIFERVKEIADPGIRFKASRGRVPEDELPAFLGSSHVTLVPSRVDTFGLSIVESMLAETPVITTPLVTHKALALPLEYAYHPKEFIHKIDQIRQMDGYAEFSKRCRDQAMKYDKKTIVDRLEKMFKDVVENG